MRETIAQESRDVAIIGGGPAGAAAALTLRRHDPARSVILIEASDYGALRVGETLHPAVQPLLRRLGVWESFLTQDPLCASGTMAVWGSASVGGQDFITGLSGHGYHIDRRRFDAMLSEQAAKSGVTVLSGTRLRSVSGGESGWELGLEDHQGRTSQIRAAFVIDAGGRKARFATLCGARRIQWDQLVGSLGFFDLKPDGRTDADTRTLVEAVEHGWWYSARLPDGHAVAAFMTDAAETHALGLHQTGAWLQALHRSQHTALRFRSAVPRGTPQLHSAASGSLNTVTGDHWLAAGDAAATFDPLSGQGIIKALRNGLLAAWAASDHLGGKPDALLRYRALIEAEIAQYREGRTRYYGEERRWPDAPFWRSRHALTE